MAGSSLINKFNIILAVDFDGCLCTNKFPEIGEPITHILDHVIECQKNGAFIILWTCREGKTLKEAVKWCNLHGLTPDAVNDNAPWIKESFNSSQEMFEACKEGRTGAKVFANWYIDDRAINVDDF